VHIRTVETKMHRSFDKSKQTVNRVYQSWDVGFFALPALLAIALIGLAITQPAASSWISEAAQVESGDSNFGSEIAQSTREFRTVRAN